jgi:hypothetical protein
MSYSNRSTGSREAEASPQPRRRGRQKPKKPRPTFPLPPHPNGSWCKKIAGKLYYFGGWDDPEAALKLYESQRQDLEAGRTPKGSPGRSDGPRPGPIAS